MEVTYFFDSHAIVGMIKLDPQYKPFEQCEFFITQFNLAEVVYTVLRLFGEERAKYICSRLRDSVAEVTDADLLNAMKLRYELKQRDLSYADAIGYAVAQRLRIKILTGDKGFTGLPGVELVV